MGFEIPVKNYPENLQEAITSFGGEDGLLTAALNYIRFHKTNSVARAAVSEFVGEETGVARETKVVPAPTKSNPDNTREEWAETEDEHVKRAIATSKRTPQDLAEKLLNGDSPLELEFNAQGVQRTAGPKKVAAVYTKAAQDLLKSDEKVVQTAIDKLQQLNPGVTVAMGEDGKPDVESLASALKANRDRRDKAAMAELGVE